MRRIPQAALRHLIDGVGGEGQGRALLARGERHEGKQLEHLRGCELLLREALQDAAERQVRQAALHPAACPPRPGGPPQRTEGRRGSRRRRRQPAICADAALAMAARTLALAALATATLAARTLALAALTTTLLTTLLLTTLLLTTLLTSLLLATLLLTTLLLDRGAGRGSAAPPRVPFCYSRVPSAVPGGLASYAP